MAHFGFENDHMERYRTIRRSHTSTTNSSIPGRGRKQRASRIGGDRYIPTRNSQHMEAASFLLTRKKEPMDVNPTVSSEKKKAWSVALNGYDIEDAKILNIGERPRTGCHNNFSVLYNQSIQKTRHVPSTPYKVMDAPELRNDFYLNLLDWSSGNVLALAVNNSVYLWDASRERSTRLMQMERRGDYICSLSWAKDGSYLAVGTSDSKVQLWDVENQRLSRSMASHTARVGSLSWNEHVLSSGSASGQIHHHDVRMANHHIFTLAGHSEEVCGLKWAPNGRFLASGGGDNLVCVWPSVSRGGGREIRRPVHRWSEHQAAVKALAWCPWQPSILASGGGTSDHHIRIWNVNSGSCINSRDAQSQISSLVYAANHRELVSAHGNNSVVVWKCPSITKVAELNDHEDRVLDVTLSPDASTVASVAADETIRLWRSFGVDSATKKDRLARSSLFRTIR